MAATRIAGVLAPSRSIKIKGGISTLRRWPVSSIIILSALFIAAVGAPLIAPYDPLQDGSLDDRHIPPMFFGGTAEHILGTDHLGRDTLSRLIYGARISMLVAAIVLVIGGGIGTLIGLVSGYFGGWVDEILMRIVDIKFSLPLILIALALAIIWGASIQLLMGLLAFLIWGSFSRQVRGEALVLKETDYVKLATSRRGIDHAHPVQAHIPRSYEHRRRRCDVPGGFCDSRGGVAEFPRRGHSTAHACMGIDGVRGSPLHHHRLVGNADTRTCDCADGDRLHASRRLDTRPGGSTSSPAVT